MSSFEFSQFLGSFKNKRLKLTLKNATYVGTVKHIDSNRAVILEEVADFNSGRKFPGIKMFCGSDILNVEFADEPKGDREGAVEQGQLAVSEFHPYRAGMNMDVHSDTNDDDYVDFTLIDEFFNKFGPAVMHIRKQQVIGLAADGVGLFPHARLCWLQIATKKKVYLFDMLLLGVRAFKNGLSMILESENILKVVHDCRGVASCLFAQYGVTLTCVFDTQAADIMHFYTETGGFFPDRVCTLQEVIRVHLKMAPLSLAALKRKEQLVKEDKEVWFVRPCPEALLKVMALSVIHLQPLRLVLLDALMSDYTSLVDSYLEHSREDAMQLLDIGSSSRLELPAELRKLGQMRQERRERALNKYPITEDGLLDRFSPRPQSNDPALLADTEFRPPASVGERSEQPSNGGGLQSMSEALLVSGSGERLHSWGTKLDEPLAVPVAGPRMGQVGGAASPVTHLPAGRGVTLNKPVSDWGPAHRDYPLPALPTAKATVATMLGIGESDVPVSFGRGLFQNNPLQVVRRAR